MRHTILALVFILLVAALLISGCAKAPAEEKGLAPDNEVEVQQESDEVAELEKDLDVEEVDLELDSLFSDY